jgi:MFS family permease
VGISGCYLIIESWLNEQTQEHLRGRVLAIYTMLVLAAMSLGQVLINVGKPESVAPVVLGSLLLSLAVVPVSLSRVRQPAKLRGVGFKLREVFHAAPAAVGGALGIGMVTGTLYTLTPVFGIRAEMDVADVSLLMIAMVAGGAMFQFPVGRVSDHFDRRRVMVTLLSAGFIVALLAGFLVVAPWALIATLFVSGGVANAIYPICLAHANDRLPGRFMQVGTVILLVNAAGAVVGPLLAAYAMAVFGAPGFFWFMAGGFVLTTAWIGSFIMRREAPLTTRRFVNTAKSSPALMALDPRASAEAEIAQPGSESDD